MRDTFVICVPAHRAEVTHAFEISVTLRIFHAFYFNPASRECSFHVQDDCVQQCGVAGVLPCVATHYYDIALSSHLLVHDSSVGSLLLAGNLLRRYLDWQSCRNAG